MDKYENDAYAIETQTLTKTNGLETLPYLQIYNVYDKKENRAFQLFIGQKKKPVTENDFLPEISVGFNEMTTSGVKQVIDIACAHFPMEKGFIKKMGTLDGLMAVYKKIDKMPEGAGQSELKIKEFLDKYIFNSDESRKVLHEFLNKGNKAHLAVRHKEKSQSKPVTFIQNLFKKHFGRE